jgi:hypothetical protein
MQFAFPGAKRLLTAGLLAALCLRGPAAGRAQEVVAPPAAQDIRGEPIAPPADLPPAGGGAPGAGGDRPAQDIRGETEGPAPNESLPWYRRVPPIAPIPRPGLFITPPTGPGYYSLVDLLTGNERAAPPRYPYPRFSIMGFSFFDADFRYLDDPNNTEHDIFDPLKRIHLGDNWLFTTGGEFRFRYMNEVDSRLTGVDNTYDLTRERVYGDLWFRDIFRVYAELLWAESFNQDLPPLVIDRNLGDFLNLFADLKVAELCDHPVYFRGGRQELLFGSQRLISPLDWANTRRTFEGGRLFYRGDKWDVDAFVVSPVVPTVNHFFSSINANEVFSGAWATYRPKAGQALDAYYLNLDNTSGTPVTLGLPAGPYNVNTVGGRWVGDANNWTWDVEGDLQFGDFQQRHILAKAFSAGAGYRFADLPMTPQLWAYYDYASGDPDPSNAHATYGTFNQLFPFGHYYFGFLDLVGRQNINDVNFQVSLFPTKWITTYLQYHVFRLDSAKDALYNAAGTPIRRDPTGAAGNDVGDELDYVINFHIDKHQDVLFGYSHLFAGQFIRQTGNGRSPELTYLQYSFRW